MNSLNFGMLHTCQVISTSQDLKLNFTSGTAVFTVGSVLTGATSEARGTIKSITLSSGSWSSGNAAGYLILSNASGVFGSETIRDGRTIPGTATSSGPAIPQTNGVGTPTTTTISTTYSCRFSNASGGVPNYISGTNVLASDIVFLPANAVVKEGDIITSSNQGHVFSYTVTDVNTLYNFFNTTIDHIEASLKAVSKRG